MRTLLLNEIEEIGGGHPPDATKQITFFGIMYLMLELPHAIHGIIEMYNYSVDWKRSGCTDIDEDDHFKHDVCALFV